MAMVFSLPAGFAVGYLFGSIPFGLLLTKLAGLGDFLGHVFPIWLRFKGGKGVATYVGVALGLAWPAALVFALFWLATALLFRRSSLAGLVASFATPFAMFAFHGTRAALLFVLLTAVLWIKHTANIERLLAGTEPNIGA